MKKWDYIRDKMGTIRSELKLKIKCPWCGEFLFGLSVFDDYYQEEHTTYCKKCNFRESFEKTRNRI